MRNHSLLLTGPKHLAWIAGEIPPLQPHEVLIQTKAGAISIGSELPVYCGTARSTTPAYYPRMTGYESGGVVIDRGSAIRRFQVGDRAVAFYGHREYGIVPEAKALKVPDGVSEEVALLVILTCDVSKGIRKVNPQQGESVLITGAGAIGLLTVFMLKAMGVQAVDVVEPRWERCDLALHLGARVATSHQEMVGKGDRYAVGFECSSRNVAFELLQEKMQQQGRICILADGNVEPLVVAPAFHEKELMLVGSSDGWDYQEHAKWYFQSVQEHPHDLQRLFDHVTTQDGLITTFEQLATGRISPIKVVVKYT
ncbi:MAG TPA: zinc-binding dehydrogenase [Ktedonobacteraceae bacterium]